MARRKTNTVSAFDAKTHLSGLLEQVKEGQEYIITKRGKPIARLTPLKDESSKKNLKRILAEFDEIRKGVKGKVSIKQLIGEGRKY